MTIVTTHTTPPPHSHAWRVTSWVFALMTVTLQICWPLMWNRFGISHAVVVCGAAAMLAHAIAAHRSRALIAMTAVVLAAWLIERIGTATSVPFGEYRYADKVTYLKCTSRMLCPVSASATNSVLMVAGIPVIVLLAWFMMAYATHITARHLAHSSLGRWVWATWLLAIWDLYLDPQFILDPHLQHGWWLWSDSQAHLPGIPGIPLQNYVGWIVAAAAIQALLLRCLTPTMGVSTMHSRMPVAFAVWTWVGGAIASVRFIEQPAAAAWGFAAGLPAALTWLVQRQRAVTRASASDEHSGEPAAGGVRR